MERFTILLLAEDPARMELFRSALQPADYRLLESASAGEAEVVCGRYQGRISLLITTISPPEPRSPETAARLRTLRPEMAILFVGSEPLERLVQRGLWDAAESESGRVFFLQEPFAATVLRARVHELLAPRAASHSS